MLLCNAESCHGKKSRTCSVQPCVGLAMEALGSIDTPLGCELHRLAVDFSNAQTMEQLNTPLIALKNYLKDIQ